MHQNSEIVWKPILGHGGVLHGLVLSSVFAKQCMEYKISKEDQSQLHDHLWRLSRPSDCSGDKYTPSDIFMFYENTLLIHSIYSRHAGSGKWLDAERMSIEDLDDEYGVTYSYHHADWGDMSRNLWLQYAFDWWSKLAYVKIARV